jgi:hypothetical protein
MRKIINVVPLEGYRLEITFEGEATEIVDIKPLLKRPLFLPLWDESFFAKVEIDHKFDGVMWPDGPDICIDWIEAEIERRKPQVKFA